MFGSGYTIFWFLGLDFGFNNFWDLGLGFGYKYFWVLGKKFFGFWVRVWVYIPRDVQLPLKM